MTRENFIKVLKAFVRRRPFRPFTLELVSGSHLEVNHPEVLRLETDLVVYSSTTSIKIVFEYDSVVRFIDATGMV